MCARRRKPRCAREGESLDLKLHVHARNIKYMYVSVKRGPSIHDCIHVIILSDRANFLGTSFTVYDSGMNPNRKHARLDSSHVRQELAAAHYVRNVHVYMYIYT